MGDVGLVEDDVGDAAVSSELDVATDADDIVDEALHAEASSARQVWVLPVFSSDQHIVGERAQRDDLAAALRRVLVACTR